MQCPLDGTELTMSERQGIEIDYCPKCRGVWLDRGELDKIIERSDATAPSQPEPPRFARQPEPYRQEQSHDHEYHRRRRKKSFLGDIFDFD